MAMRGLVDLIAVKSDYLAIGSAVAIFAISFLGPAETTAQPRQSGEIQRSIAQKIGIFEYIVRALEPTKVADRSVVVVAPAAR